MTILGDLPVGGRLMVRSRVDWRTAVVSRVAEDSVTLSVASPKGRNYRLRREPDHTVDIANGIPVLLSEIEESWFDNFAGYDARW